MENLNLTKVSGVAQHMCCACTIATVFAVCAATKAFGFEATPTMARGYPSPFDGYQPWTPRKAHSHSSSKIGDAPSAPGAKSAEIVNLERPLFAVISIADQHVSIYNNHGLVARSAISTGMPGHPTPKGMFTIIGRERFHRSNIYSDAPMPFMQRITWSGIAMHLGVVPGHPASHGCIRLPAEFAAKLWGLTKIGERVVISPQEVTPIEFTHPLLPVPKMRVAGSDQADPDLPHAALASGQPTLINPHQYAEQLKAKAVAERAEAVKTIKETSAAVRVAQREATRSAAEIIAAEAVHSSAEAKAESAAKAYDMAVEAASATQQESILVTELEDADGNVSGRSAADPLSTAQERGGRHGCGGNSENEHRGSTRRCRGEARGRRNGFSRQGR